MLMLVDDIQASGVWIMPTTAATSLPLQTPFPEEASGIMQHGFGERKPQQCLPQNRSCSGI